MKQSQYGLCGIYCGACGATDCGGCWSDEIDETIEQCKFRICSKEKNLEFCCYCDEYPCDELNKFMHDKWPHHWTIKSNLEFIKKHSKEEWLKAQKKEWSCDNCGTRIVWYQKKCTCGQDLDAWKVPA